MEKTISNSKVQSSVNAKKLALDGMFIALTFVFTACVNIKIPSFGGAGGLIHLGNIPLFIAAMLYGKWTGAVAGALGMGLFDVVSGWAAWSPCTFITCGLMGFVVGLICEKSDSWAAKITAYVAALAIKLLGYFLFESFIMGSGVAAAIKSVPGNVIQVVVAAVLVSILIQPLEKGIKAVER